MLNMRLRLSLSIDLSEWQDWVCIETNIVGKLHDGVVVLFTVHIVQRKDDVMVYFEITYLFNRQRQCYTTETD